MTLPLQYRLVSSGDPLLFPFGAPLGLVSRPGAWCFKWIKWGTFVSLLYYCYWVVVVRLRLRSESRSMSVSQFVKLKSMFNQSNHLGRL